MRIRNFVLLTGCTFVFLWLFLPTSGHGYDVACFQRWTVFIHEHGLRHAYELPGLDYNPLFLELLWVFGNIQGTTQHIQAGFFTFKLIVLLFDLGGVFLAAALLRLNHRNVALACFLLFNVAYFYNNLIWGQVDSVFTFFVALSVFLSIRKKVLLSLISGLLAVNFKLIAAAFVPLILLLNLPQMLRDKKVLPRAVLVGLALQAVIFVPFLSHRGLASIVAANETQIRSSAILSPSGYNFWLLVAGVHTDRPAATIYHGLAMKTWGASMFFIAAGVVLLPLLRITLIQKGRVSDASVLLASALYGLAFFFFMTGMHERYSHPLVLLFGLYAVLSGRYFVYLALSLAVFLNMERCFFYFHLSTYDTVIFNSHVIAVLFLIVLLVGTLKVYRETTPLP